MGSQLFESSAIAQLMNNLRFDRLALLLIGLDVLFGLLIWNAVYEVDTFRWLDHLSNLISNVDEVISWLTSNPVGLKLNEPVNFALASFFRYHVYLWHTFVQFLYVPWLIRLVQFSFCLGLSCGIALCTDLISIFTLHIHCFDVYASRLVLDF